MKTRRRIGFATIWVFVGALLIVGLHEGLVALFGENLGVRMVDGLGGFLGRLVFGGVVTSASFIVGGFLVGLLSPGETLREPGLASMLALAAMTAIRVRWYGMEIQPAWIVLTAALGYGVGMLGGWLGEQAQTALKRRRSHTE